MWWMFEAAGRTDVFLIVSTTMELCGTEADDASDDNTYKYCFLINGVEH